MRRQKQFEPDRISIEKYIWGQFLEFIQQDGNYIEIDGQRQLHPDKEFIPLKIKNRSNLICDIIWRKVLLNHLNNYNYN